MESLQGLYLLNLCKQYTSKHPLYKSSTYQLRVIYIYIYIKEKYFLFVTNTILQSITSSVMCSLHLTHPSAHTPGAVGGSVPCSRVSPQSWTIPAWSQESNPQPQVTSPTLYPLEPRLPTANIVTNTSTAVNPGFDREVRIYGTTSDWVL